ncbi:MAG: hypothetical protein K6G62_08930 [Eubacterium sp.]|nr:hypothetical protein [Eubacterium sp.]
MNKKQLDIGRKGLVLFPLMLVLTAFMLFTMSTRAAADGTKLSVIPSKDRLKGGDSFTK